MKSFNIFMVHGKLRFLGRGFTRNQYIGGLPKKGGLGQFADLEGETWQERGGVGVFEGGSYSNAHCELEDYLGKKLAEPNFSGKR